MVTYGLENAFSALPMRQLIMHEQLLLILATDASAEDAVNEEACCE